MPRYTFTGAYPRVLTGLREGVNAHLDPEAPPLGATIEARPGDELTTDAPYEHPELAESETPDVTPPPATPEPEPAPVTEPAPAPVGFDPAHDAMTADGAPAPAAA